MTEVVYVLFRSVGEYSDRSEWPFCFVRGEELAKALTLRAGNEWRGATATFPKPDYPDFPAELEGAAYDAAYAEHKKRCEERVEAVRSMLTVDRGAPDDCEYDEPYYFYREVPLLASADTHPKDGDAQQAPLVSGAVPDRADAQKGAPNADE